MAATDELDELVRRALALRLTMDEICEAAQVHRVTMWRWRNGVTDPRPAELETAVQGLQQAIQERRRVYDGV